MGPADGSCIQKGRKEKEREYRSGSEKGTAVPRIDPGRGKPDAEDPGSGGAFQRGDQVADRKNPYPNEIVRLSFSIIDQVQ